MAKGLNVNWIKDLVIENENTLINDTTWFVKRDKISADFTVVMSDSSKLLSFMGHRQIDYSDVRVNEPIPEVIVDKDGVRVQDAVRDSRSSAQDMVKGAEAGNPANGQTAERQSRPSGIALQHTERTPAEADALWADVNASIEEDFADRVEAQRQRKLELYNQYDPLLNQNSAPKKVQTKTSVRPSRIPRKCVLPGSLVEPLSET